MSLQKNIDLPQPTSEEIQMSYSETLQYLYDRLPVFHHVGADAYKPGLDNSIQLMEQLGNPQQQYKTIHIAGTNGKGSVSHLLAAVLHEAGYTVGLYTSPHLVDFGERIRVNGTMIDQQYVVDFVAKNVGLFSEIEPSFFEATMAMAFDYFAHSKVDVAIIEVGLGGRLDSTNIIHPDLSIITNISFDHVGFLGDTLAKIAFEKAGIIKPYTPVVIGESLSETRPVFVEKSKIENAPLIFAEDSLQFYFKEYSEGIMLVEDQMGQALRVGLCGLYQLKNIATTLTAIEQLQQLNYTIPELAITNGLEHVIELTGLQGRWQQLQQSPTVVCDTGHNVAGISYVVEQLSKQNFNTLRIVIGMVNDKDVSAVLAVLPKVAQYYFTQANIARALSANDLMLQAAHYQLNGNAYATVNDAVKAAINDASATDFVFIGGSNFIVGEALPCFLKNSLF